MVARKLSRTDQYYFDLYMHYGVHCVTLAQGIYELFLERYQDQSDQGKDEQRKLLSQLMEVLSHHLDVIAEGLKERQKASAREDNVIVYDTDAPAYTSDEHYLSLMTMYGNLWIGKAHTGSSVLKEFLFDEEPLTSAEIAICFEAIAESLKQFRGLIERIRAGEAL